MSEQKLESDNDAGESDLFTQWKPELTPSLVAYLREEVGELLGACGFDLQSLSAHTIAVEEKTARRIVIGHPKSNKPCVLYSEQSVIGRDVKADETVTTFAAVARSIRHKLRMIVLENAEYDRMSFEGMTPEKLRAFIARGIRVRLQQQKRWDKERSERRGKRRVTEPARSALQKLRSSKNLVENGRSDRRVFLVPSFPKNLVLDYVEDLAAKNGFGEIEILELKPLKISPDGMTPQRIGKAAAAMRRAILELAKKRGFAALWSSPELKDRWTVHVFVPTDEVTSIVQDVHQALWPAGDKPPYVRILSQNVRVPSAATHRMDQEWSVSGRGDRVTISDDENVRLTLSAIEELHAQFPNGEVIVRLDMRMLKEEELLIIEIYFTEHRSAAQGKRNRKK